VTLVIALPVAAPYGGRPAAQQAQCLPSSPCVGYVGEGGGAMGLGKGAVN
jgi:hypothetical protein